MTRPNRYSDELTGFLEELRNHGGFSEDVSDINDKASCGDLPIHWAAYWGRIEIVKEIVELELDVNAKGEADLTPLDYAIMGNQQEVVLYLKLRGGEAEHFE